MRIVEPNHACYKQSDYQIRTIRLTNLTACNLNKCYVIQQSVAETRQRSLKQYSKQSSNKSSQLPQESNVCLQ